jgi:hypothetical protein
VPQHQLRQDQQALASQEHRLDQGSQATQATQVLLVVPVHRLVQDYQDFREDPDFQQHLHMLILRITLLRKPGLLITPEG